MSKYPIEREMIEAMRTGGVDLDEIDDPPLQSLEHILRQPLRISLAIDDPVLRDLARCIKARKALIAAHGKDVGNNPYEQAFQRVVRRPGRGGSGDYDSLLKFCRTGGVDLDEIDDPPRLLGSLAGLDETQHRNPDEIPDPILRGLMKFLKANWKLAKTLRGRIGSQKKIGNPYVRALEVSVDQKLIDSPEKTALYESLRKFLENAGIDPGNPPSSGETGGPIERLPVETRY